MALTVKLNGETYQCPGSWAELTTAQHKQILSWDNEKEIHERDFLKLFGILTGTDFKAFNATAVNEVELWECVRWVVEQPFVTEMPKALKVGNKIALIPKSVLLSSIGQNIVMRQTLDKSTVYTDSDGKIIDYNCYAEAVAIYLQPILNDEPFDYGKASELIPVIEQMPAYLIKPLGFFLLTQQKKHGKRRTKSWLRTLNNLISRRNRQPQGSHVLTFWVNGKTFGLSESMRGIFHSIRMRYLQRQALTPS